jgi:hypothetical protein
VGARQKPLNHRFLVALNFNFLPFALHEIGALTVFSAENASPRGLGHLANFMSTVLLGTDMMDAQIAARRSYGEDRAGPSIQATNSANGSKAGRLALVLEGGKLAASRMGAVAESDNQLAPVRWVAGCCGRNGWQP